MTRPEGYSPLWPFLHRGADVARRRQRSFVVGLSTGVVLLSLLCGRPTSLQAQDAPFKPRWDAIERSSRHKFIQPTPAGSSANENTAVYSFDRYSGQLREICNLMELDHRRERFGKAAFDDIRNGTPCKSCRAFLKEVVEQCQYRKKVVVRPTPSPRSTATPLPGEPSGQSTVPPPQHTAAATPTPSEPQRARYPRTELIDRVSALSADLYERDTGDGPLFESINYLSKLLVGQKDLSPAERDYFGIVTTYLLSAWSGRADSPLEHTGPDREGVRALFDEH